MIRVAAISNRWQVAFEITSYLGIKVPSFFFIRNFGTQTQNFSGQFRSTEVTLTRQPGARKKFAILLARAHGPKGRQSLQAKMDHFGPKWPRKY